MTGQEAHPWPRRVIAPARREVDRTLAAFCGIHGDRWVRNAIESMEHQSVRPIQIVIAVNGNGGEAVAFLTDYQSTSPHEVWVVVNESNLGPAGSFDRNRDLIEACWTAFLHQDDIYLPSHLEVLRAMALTSSDSTVALFTALGGISEDGQREMAPPPMENARLRRQRSWRVVPEIIRQHPFPTPAAAIRSDLKTPGIAWYDSGAPDSEWFTRLACVGSVDVIDQVTVLYRQPPDSESSKTDWYTRAWLWAASLSRIIDSSEFFLMLQEIPLAHRDEFAEAILSAIPARYPSAPLFEYLQFLAAQRMCQAWDYTDHASLTFVAQTISQWGPGAATTSLEALLGESIVPTSNSHASQLLGRAPRTTWLEAKGREAYRRYGHKLPVGTRRASVAAYRAFRGRAT